MGRIIKTPDGPILMSDKSATPVPSSAASHVPWWRVPGAWPPSKAERAASRPVPPRSDLAESRRQLAEAQAARHERTRFVLLHEAAKRLDVRPNDLASAVIGKVTMRAADDGLELDRDELEAALPDLPVRTIGGGRDPVDSGIASSAQYGVVSSNRKPRPRLGSPERVPSLRPWARD